MINLGNMRLYTIIGLYIEKFLFQQFNKNIEGLNKMVEY